ncbi:MAG: DUF192 domain-containing protein [Acidobacteriota bacterium]
MDTHPALSRLGAMIAIATLGLACAGGPPASPPPPSPAPTTVVLPNGFTVRVEPALNPLEQARGLMFVEFLAPDEGMLFLFDTEEARPFWMKNCKIPLDLVWLDAGFRVVEISPDVPPCPGDPCPSYAPSVPIRHVLEVNGGFCALHGLRPGDQLLVVGLPPHPRGEGMPG